MNRNMASAQPSPITNYMLLHPRNEDHALRSTPSFETSHSPPITSSRTASVHSLLERSQSAIALIISQQEHETGLGAVPLQKLEQGFGPLSVFQWPDNASGFLQSVPPRPSLSICAYAQT